MQKKHWRLLAVLVLAALAGCGGKKEEGSGGDSGDKAWTKPFDTAFVTPDCFGAIIVHPQRIAQSPALAGSPEMAEMEKSAGFKEILDNLGFDPRDLEQAAFLYAPPPADAGPRAEPGAVGVLRWTKSVDGKSVLLKWNKNMELREDKHAGKTYFTRILKGEVLRGSASREAYYLPDDRTVVICTSQKQLQAVLDSGGKKGPMSEYLRGLDLDRDVVAAFVAEPVKDILQGMSKELGQAIPGMSELGKAPGYVKSAALGVNLGDAEMLKLTVDATDAKGAESLHNIATGLVGMAKAMYPDAREKMIKAPGGPPEELKKTIVDLADQAVAGLSVAKSGDKVEISLRMKDAQSIKKLLPAFSQAVGDARTAAQDAVQMSRLAQLSMAMFNSEMRDRRFPADVRSAGGKPLLSWRVQLLPFIEGGEIYKEFKLDEPWDSEHNKKLIPKIPEIFRSDSKDKLPEGHTTVMAFIGAGTPFGVEKGVSVPGIKDGLSHTIALVAVGPDKAVPWTKPQDLPFDPANPIAALGKISDRGFIVAMFDGSIHRLRKDIPAAALKALITHAGGEPVDISAVRAR